MRISKCASDYVFEISLMQFNHKIYKYTLFLGLFEKGLCIDFIKN